MLGVMASYSITVKELKLLFSMLRGENGIWVSKTWKRLLERGTLLAHAYISQYYYHHHQHQQQ